MDMGNEQSNSNVFGIGCSRSYVCVTDTFNGINGKIPIDIYVASSLVPKVSGTFINLKMYLPHSKIVMVLIYGA